MSEHTSNRSPHSSPEKQTSNHSDPASSHWIRMSFKGNKVWVETDEHKIPIERAGKVRIKYNVKQEYEYLVKKENLEPESNAVPSQKKRGQRKKKSEKKKQQHHFVEKKEQATTQRQDRRMDDKTVPDNEKAVPDNAIVIYTDGASSGNPGPSGIGIFLRHGPHEKEISEYIGHATSNIAELSAIKRALSQLKRNDLPVRLFTDSNYALGVLTKPWKPNKNKELIAKTKTLMKNFKDLEIIKVKGHDGLEGNEKADALATQAYEGKV